MIPDRKEPRDSNVWSFVFATIFGILIVWAGLFLQSRGVDFKSMGVFEFVVVSLAVFRITRLLVYDSIAYFIRDIFHVRKVVWSEKEQICVVKRTLPRKGIRRKFAELLHCPWCVGTWVALGVLFLYYIHPIGWWFILGVAIAGVATFIQILSNLIGWNAEGSKLDVGSRLEVEGCA